MTASAQVGPSTSGGPAPLLTATQTRILHLITEGHDQEQVAYIVRHSPKTIGFQLKKIREAFGAFNNAHLVHLAYQAGALEAPPKRRHGDHAGFAAHKYRGETPCDDCVAGEKEYQAAKYTRKRAKLNAA
ncbi:helix-turn-helix transcriptional regulator [Streptomyces angustmyceticus]|uniref:helix-turn-helix transcriptional regulator n=1 Tax=Streptomyces angustmyceticus TaxID=285578 RepID=UPI00368A41D3